MSDQEKKAFYKSYHRIIRLFLLAILALMTVLSVPALCAQVGMGNLAFRQVSTAQSLLQQGIASYQAGNYAEAAKTWRQALEAFAANKDRLNQALVLSNLSLADQHLGKLEDAQEKISQSLNLVQSVPSQVDSPIYTEIFAKALNTQASLQWAKGQLEAALQTWQQATVYYAKADQEQGVIGSLINQAQALQALGLHLKAEEKFQAINLQLEQQSDPYLQATGWLNLGKTFRKIGRLTSEHSATLPSSSWEVLQKSLAAARLSNNQNLETSVLIELGNTQRALANKATAIEQTQKAKEYREQALNYYKQAAQNSSPQKLKAQLNWLSLLVETRQHSQVKALVKSIQEEIAPLPSNRTEIFEQLNFARSLTCLQAPPDNNSPWCQEKNTQEQELLVPWSEIAQIIANAAQQAQIIGDMQAQSYALGQLGGLYELNQQWQDAQNLTEQAISTIEQLQANHLLYRWEWQLGRLLEQKQDKEGAITAYQTAVSTLSSVATDLIYVDSDLQFSFQENIEPLYRKLIDLLLPEESITAQNKLDLLAARENIQLLQRAELESFLRCSLQDIKTRQIDERVDHPGSTEAVIYPIQLEKRIGIILKLPNSPQILAYSSPLEAVNIEEIVTQLEKDLRFSGRKKAVQKNAQILYQLLIQPLEDELQAHNINTLVFLLDAPFRNIPMAVLYDGEQYLMEKYAVAVTSGLELLESQALIAGNFHAALAGLSQSRQGYSALPNVVSQFEQIQSTINTETILDEEFTVEGLQKLLNSLPFPVVHIATHGQFSSQPEETFLVAWNDKIYVNDLRSLLRDRAQTRPEPIELLVLAACETSQGDKRAALGLAGIAVNSGARSTLATLWKIIADESPGSLLSHFYRQLRDNPQITKAQALRNAQLQLLQDSNKSSPYYWAPYILIGNWL